MYIMYVCITNQKTIIWLNVLEKLSRKKSFILSELNNKSHRQRTNKLRFKKRIGMKFKLDEEDKHLFIEF